MKAIFLGDFFVYPIKSHRWQSSSRTWLLFCETHRDENVLISDFPWKIYKLVFKLNSYFKMLIWSYLEVAAYKTVLVIFQAFSRLAVCLGYCVKKSPTLVTQTGMRPTITMDELTKLLTPFTNSLYLTHKQGGKDFWRIFQSQLHVLTHTLEALKFTKDQAMLVRW